MPQSRKPAARSGRSSAKPRKAARPKPPAKRGGSQSRGSTAAKASSSPTSQARSAASQASRSAAASAAAESSLFASLGVLRDTLTRGIVLTRERITDTLDDAVRRGRMTREDAEELTASLVGVGRRGAQDLVADVEQLLGRSRQRTAESTDAIVRQVDRARRVAGIGPTFPILGYDDLTAAQIAERLTELTPAELRKVRDHERRNANRKSVLTAIERALR